MAYLDGGKRSTIKAMMKRLKWRHATCSGCYKYPWECSCKRTRLDLAKWLKQVADKLLEELP